MGYIPYFVPHWLTNAEFMGFIPYLPPHWLANAEFMGFIPYFPSHWLTNATFTGYIPYFPPHWLANAEFMGFIPYFPPHWLARVSLQVNRYKSALNSALLLEYKEISVKSATKSILGGVYTQMGWISCSFGYYLGPGFFPKDKNLYASRNECPLSFSLIRPVL
ncbi:hypothetical protein B9T62_37750 [Paenibacillus donghaensis]|uniref:Uncharacterized protein n=1 Tax=Paenibacillus donghaensis TaxID=414771 RepID=A0A2Z2KJ26_9BACL|nr:hypothetical protein B9T62_37750 [Paenibacillus donghaensis]